ncbi:hypothetical protein SVIOM342S_10257 [Streptomyces violaceorubidus]
MLDRVGVRDAEQVVDERARAGAARGDPDAHVPYVVHDLGDGEEVRGEAVVGDDVQLVVHPLPVLPAARHPVVAAPHHARRRPGGERPLGGAPAGTDQVRFGEVDGAHAEVVLGVDQALGGRGPGLLQQTVGGVAPETRGLDDPLGGVPHGTGVLEPGLTGVQFLAGADRDQAAGGVQDVGDLALAGVGVADGVGEHRPDALLGGEAHGAGGQPQGAGAGALAAVPDGLQAQGVAVDLPPGGEEPGRAVGAARGEGAADVGVGAEQDGQPVGVVVGPGQQRAALGRVGGGDQAAQVGPAAGAVAGEEGHPCGRLVDEGAAAHGDAAPVPAYGGVRAAGFRLGGRDRQLRAEQGADARLRAGLGEADRAREGVAVGEGEGVHAPLEGALGQPLRMGGAVTGGETGDGVQVRETRHHAPPDS